MLDILLDKSGDITVSDLGDIELTNSVMQAVKVHLRWILGEWRLGPRFGFPWFEEVFVKNPNIDKIKNLVRSEIMSIDGVRDAIVEEVRYSAKARSVTFRYICYVGEETYREELVLHA